MKVINGGKCRVCDGEGTIDCPECEGVGEYEEYDEMVECEECLGTGAISCDVCEGTGEVSDDE